MTDRANEWVRGRLAERDAVHLTIPDATGVTWEVAEMVEALRARVAALEAGDHLVYTPVLNEHTTVLDAQLAGVPLRDAVAALRARNAQLEQEVHMAEQAAKRLQAENEANEWGKTFEEWKSERDHLLQRFGYSLDYFQDKCDLKQCWQRGDGVFDLLLNHTGMTSTQIIRHPSWETSTEDKD